MGHQNTQFSGRKIDMETDQDGHSHLHPQPSFFYGNVANFPQPNFHSVVPAPENQSNFNLHHTTEHNSALYYGPQYNAIQPQHQSSHYSPYLTPRSSVQVNQVAHDVRGSFKRKNAEGAFTTNQYHTALAGPSSSAIQPPHQSSYYSPYLAPRSSVQVNQVAQDVRGSFKRKNAEGAFENNQYHTALAGPSSSTPTIAGPVASHIDQMESIPFMQTEYIGNDPASVVEHGLLRSVRNRPAVIEHNPSRVIRGSYVGPPVQFPGNPSLDMHFGVNNSVIGTYAWSQAQNLPYLHASANAASLDSGNSGIQGYQMTTSNRSSTGFLHPSVYQGHPNSHYPIQPMQEGRGYNSNFTSQMATSSHRNPITTTSSNTYLALVPPTGFRLYQPHRREIVLDSNARYRSVPRLRALPLDDVAPGYYEVGNSIDQHRDMRLDIDQMSYEELLALGEQIGCVATGLSEEFIGNNLNTRNFTSSAACISIGEATCPDHQINFCVICQNDYENEENIGILDCGHDYHGECVKKWLLVKNTCPVCKSTALSEKEKKDL